MVKYLLILISVIGSLATYAGQSKCKNGNDYFQCVQYIRNYDADTITFKLDGIHPLLGDKIPIRVRGIDTPELRTKNQCEKKTGYKAKALVNQKITAAKRIDLVRCSRGKYFRLVCSVLLDSKLLSDILIKNKYAYKYDGGTKSRIDWCNYRTKNILDKCPSSGSISVLFPSISLSQIPSPSLNSSKPSKSSFNVSTLSCRSFTPIIPYSNCNFVVRLNATIEDSSINSPRTH
ncbi:MAG: thermonuclease family protein [Bacteriovoracaceae bacterium]